MVSFPPRGVPKQLREARDLQETAVGEDICALEVKSGLFLPLRLSSHQLRLPPLLGSRAPHHRYSSHHITLTHTSARRWHLWTLTRNSSVG
jgi:hypothetical protein